MKQEDAALEKIRRPVVRLQAEVLAFAGAALGGLGLFVITPFLVVKRGETVGPHLRLLRWYFPGYSVTWVGAFVGFVYGALVGGVAGAAIGTIYNALAMARHRAAHR